MAAGRESRVRDAHPSGTFGSGFSRLINARRPAAVTTAASGLDVTLPTAAPLTVPIARVVARTTATPSPLMLGIFTAWCGEGRALFRD